MTKRAALYLRQSKADDGQGPERQLERTRKLADARGWRVVGSYVDNGVSASKTRGAGTAWDRMLRDADMGLVDVVIGVDLDRLLRSTRDLNILVDHKLQVVTVDGEIDLTTADGEFRATMLAGIARFEVRRKGERQQRANAQRAARGGVPKGVRLTGYATDGSLIPEEAARVRSMFEAFAAGESLHGLGREFELPVSTIRTILTNPRYAGRRVYKGQVVASVEAGDTLGWDAVVDGDLFDLVNRRLADPARVTNRTGSTARKHLGTSLFRCGECAAELEARDEDPADAPTVRTAGSGGRYWCRTRGTVRRMSDVDEFVKGVLYARLTRDDARDALAPRPDLDPLREAATALRGRKAGLASLVADGTLSPAEVKEAAAGLDAKLREIEEQIDAIESPAALAVTAEEIEAGLDALSTDRLRAVIDLMMTVHLFRGVRGRRTFDPHSVRIDWR